jgi:hypothetical protein
MWATLATILNVFKRCQKEDVDQYQKVPLEEEWKLYGLDSMMSLFHAPIDFESVPAPSNVSILNSIRIESILQYGNWLASQGNEKSFRLENGIYTSPSEATKDEDESRPHDEKHSTLVIEVRSSYKSLNGDSNLNLKEKKDKLRSFHFILCLLGSGRLCSFRLHSPHKESDQKPKADCSSA